MPGRKGEVRAVARALQVLDLLGTAAPEGLRVTEVAGLVGVDPATASRLLATLAAWGYASRMLDRRYTLGSASIRLATSWLDRRVQTLTPHLARLAAETGESAYLLQLLGSEAVVVARMLPPHRSAYDVEVGEAFPLWATAAGQALLSGLTAGQRLRLLPCEPYPAFTTRTPTGWSALCRAVTTGERNDVFEEHGHLQDGLGCFAAPLFKSVHGEHLAVAVSFEMERSVGDQAMFRQMLRGQALRMRAQA